MKKKRLLSVLLFLSDLLLLVLMHYMTGLGKSVFIFRYSVVYLILSFIFGIFRCNTNMIWDEFEKILSSHLCFFLITQCMISSRNWTIMYLWKNLIVSFVLMVMTLVFNRYYRILFRDKIIQNVVIFGTGDNAKRMEKVFRSSRFTMSRVIAVVDLNDTQAFPGFQQSKKNFIAPVISYDDIDRFLNKNTIDEAIIAVPDADKQMNYEMYHKIRNHVQLIKSVAKTDGSIAYKAKVEDFDGTVLVSSSNGRINQDIFGMLIKRMFDLLAGILGLIILPFAALYVRHGNRKCKDYGKLIYRQTRIGKNGKPFEMLKFRSMIEGAEEELEKLMDEDPEIRKEYQENKKLKNDPRITEFGEKIRSSSIDELPQLINVLKGEMSLVGPRPYLFREIDDMGDTYQSVISCKPGITGMWQTHGRNDIPFQERLQLDDYYYRNWSIWLDLTILFKTAKVVIYHDGAY